MGIVVLCGMLFMCSCIVICCLFIGWFFLWFG